MKRSERVYVRMTEEEKKKTQELAAVYGMGDEVSEFFRAVINYIDDKRPVLAVKISPKGKGE